MKNWFAFTAICMLASLVIGCASTSGSGHHSQGYDFSSIGRVAVVSINGKLNGEAQKNALTDIFNEQLLARGYQPIDRQQVASVIKEAGFQNQDVTGSANAAEIGQLANVDAAVIINVPSYEGQMTMSVKLVDVETSDILWVANGNASTGSGLSQAAGTLMGAAAGAAASESADGDDTDTVVSGAAGAVGGNLAGRALTPEKTEQARKLVTKLLKSLPKST